MAKYVILTRTLTQGQCRVQANAVHTIDPAPMTSPSPNGSVITVAGEKIAVTESPMEVARRIEELD